MCLCKIYNIDTSEFGGINAYDEVQEQDNMKASIRLLKEQGYSAPKQLLRILLLALSPSEMAMAVFVDGTSGDAAILVATATSTSPVSNIESYKITYDDRNFADAALWSDWDLLLPSLRTWSCKRREFCSKDEQMLRQVLDELEYRMGWGKYETKEETLQEKRCRYLDSAMCDVSDDEHWRHIHLGAPYGLILMMKLMDPNLHFQTTQCSGAAAYLPS